MNWLNGYRIRLVLVGFAATILAGGGSAHAEGTWTRKADMLTGTSSMGSVVLDDKIIVIGGWIHSNALPYTIVQIYDPKTDIWTREADAPFLRSCFSASVVNNRIYVIGGTNRPHPCPATSTVYEMGLPLPDFNGDGIVDAADVSIMVDHWHTDESLYDIAPAPFGDGIVDVLDLIVLAEYLFTDFRLVAQWDLDETKGDIAHDSIFAYDGICHGEPLWQPSGGKQGGALQLDGVDDYISTPFILNPDKVFSAFVWIKGGISGQAIISQSAGRSFGSEWLSTDISTGTLITGLMTFIDLLKSQAVVTDGQWHDVGLVWDGSRRRLYVDGVKVAEDTMDVPFLSCDGGLYIGAGVDLESVSFFSGLIDDVRIYNVALSAEEIETLTR